MKRALTALWLLLILTAVSTGPGIAWAAENAQDFMVFEDPSRPGAADASGDTTVLMGDPDDAITGNRGAGVNEEVPPYINALSGVVEAADADVDDLIQLWIMLQNLGLI